MQDGKEMSLGMMRMDGKDEEMTGRMEWGSDGFIEGSGASVD
jgi:hypothetical protein